MIDHLSYLVAGIMYGGLYYLASTFANWEPTRVSTAVYIGIAVFGALATDRFSRGREE